MKVLECSMRRFTGLIVALLALCCRFFPLDAAACRCMGSKDASLASNHMLLLKLAVTGCY
jgi:hypothetical protein